MKGKQFAMYIGIFVLSILAVQQASADCLPLCSTTPENDACTQSLYFCGCEAIDCSNAPWYVASIQGPCSGFPQCDFTCCGVTIYGWTANWQGTCISPSFCCVNRNCDNTPMCGQYPFDPATDCPAVPEFSTITAIIAMTIVLVGAIILTLRQQKKRTRK